MVDFHKKNLLSLANKAVRQNKKFKYDLLKAALIAISFGAVFGVINNIDQFAKRRFGVLADYNDFKKTTSASGSDLYFRMCMDGKGHKEPY